MKNILLLSLGIAYYAFGVFRTLKDWADEFDEISLSFLIFTVILAWLVWPLTTTAVHSSECIIWRRK